MLLEFILENSFSYKEEAYFSMEAVKKTQIKNEFDRINNHRILKSAIIFGPNASGKSNLIKSLNTFENIVLKDDRKRNPFPTFAGNSKPIKYSITILYNNIVYRYSIEFTADEIKREKLEYQNTNKEFISYFERTGHKYSVIPDDLKPLIEKTRKDNLFLNTAKTFNDTHCLNVFRWFVRNLYFISRDVPTSIQLGRVFKIQKDKNKKQRLLSFLKAADLNIVDFEVLESNITVPDELKDILKISKDLREFKEYRMVLEHKNFDKNGEPAGVFKIDFNNESDGTQKIIELATVLLTFKNSTILIDEFDDSFHVALSKAMIEVFNSDENTNQFILTSHELALMDSGFKKEQIYFTERNSYSFTELYSVYDFKSSENRSDYSYVKRYKDGTFGAVPEILVGRLKEAISE